MAGRGWRMSSTMGRKKTVLQKINGLILQARVPAYLHRFGPKKYTSIEHCRAWLSKEAHRCSWQDYLDDWAAGELSRVPERTTLIKFVKRLPAWLKAKLTTLSAGIEAAEFGAIDSTGLSRTSASSYYVKRIDRDEPLKRCLKLSLYTTKRRILSFRLRAKWRGDAKDVKYLLNHSATPAGTNCLDKGYDAEYVHREFRSRGLWSIIPARKGCRRGTFRKQMRDCLDYAQYWQRNCAEYNNSSFKRRFGAHLRSRTFRAQHSEVSARVVLHNLKAILLRLFHRSHAERRY